MKDRTYFASFDYNKILYMLFYTEDGGIEVDKYVQSKDDAQYNDGEFIKRVIQELYRQTKLNYGYINVGSIPVNVHYNNITDEFSYSKVVNRELKPCNDKETEYLNNIFKYPVYYYFGDNYNNDDDKFGFSNQTSSNSSFFGSSNNSSSLDDNNDEYDYIKERVNENKKRRDAEKKKKIKKVTIVVGTVAVVVSIVVSALTYFFKYKFNNRNVADYTPSPTATTNVIQDLGDIEGQIRLRLQGEEEWVIQSVISQIKEMYGIQNQKNENDTSIKLNRRAQHVMDLIQQNSNIDNESKQILVNYYSTFLNNYIHHFSDEHYEDICEKITSLKVIKNYQDNGYKQIGSDKVGGQYVTKENTIYLYANDPSILTHEFLHFLGSYNILVAGGQDFMSEGYVELLNPLRSSDTYGTEQIVLIILGEIYGQDFMMDAFFSGGLFMVQLNNRFGLSDYDINPHWFLIRDKVSGYLAEVQDVHYSVLSTSYAQQTMEILELLKQEYKTVTGLDWENNDTLKACFDLLTKSNTLGLANHTKLNGVYLKASSTGYVIEKTIVVPYDDPYGNAQTGIFTANDYIDSGTKKR